MVGAVLNRRKAPIGRTHKNFYAADLRRLVRTGKGEQETLDRLLVSALIEARSCERFEVLEHLCTDPELRRLYRTLFASERGHFTAFLRLAEHDLPPETVEARWTELLAHEERIINEQAVGYRIHSGVPPE
jgi:tRNA-(ms[2]io[6]A)-hydroxylase